MFAATLNDMKSAKEELVARMNESRMADIIFGTVCDVPNGEVSRHPVYPPR